MTRNERGKAWEIAKSIAWWDGHDDPNYETLAAMIGAALTAAEDAAESR